MSQELCYTSAPRGLWPGSQGYCTVACTDQMSRALVERLEGLSAYRNPFPAHDRNAHLNPVAFSHVTIAVAGATCHVLSRVCFAGLDYTDRTNKFAHHVVLEAAELPREGPAWLLSRRGFLRESWDGRVEVLPRDRPIPREGSLAGSGQGWRYGTGVAEWAGLLAGAFLADPRRLVFLIYDPGIDLLPLLADVQALLPPEHRWDHTFSTYFSNLPQGVACAWRGVMRGSPEELPARGAARALVVDLAQGPDGDLGRKARPGVPAASALPSGSASPLPHRRPFAAARREWTAATTAAEPSERVPTPQGVAGGPAPRAVSRPARRIAAPAVVASSLVLFAAGLLAAFRFAGPAEPRKRTEPLASLHEGPGAGPAEAGKVPGRDAAPSEELPGGGTGERQEPGPPPVAAAPTDRPGGEPAPDDRPPPAQERSLLHYHYWNMFPLTNDDSGESTLALPSLPPGDCELKLLGIDDDELRPLTLSARADAGGTLTVHGGPSGVALATFRVTGPEGGREVRFRWAASPDPREFDEHCKAVRACLLSVRARTPDSREGREWRIVLRGRVGEPKRLSLSSLGRTIDWGEHGRPYHRPIEIQACELNGGAIGPKPDQDHPGRFRDFAAAGLDGLVLRVQLDATAESKFNVRMTLFSPENQLVELFAKYANSDDKIVAKNQLVAFRSQFARRQTGDLGRSLATLVARLEGMSRGGASPPPQGARTGVAEDIEFFEKCERFLETLSGLKSREDEGFSIVVAMRVGGELVEVARIGDFEGDEGGASPGGPKPR